MIRLIAVFIPVLLLSACSSVLKGATQEVTLITPGAEDARCDVENSYFRYTINTPRTFRLERTPEPYKITCMAPGNRVKTIVIPAGYEDKAFLNASNGVIPGAAVDAASGALFAYPEMIAVDFRGIRTHPSPLPDYQLMLKENPLIAGMEEFRPGVAAMQRDEQTVVQPMQRRQADSYGDAFGTMNVIGSDGGTPEPAAPSASSDAPAASALSTSVPPAPTVSGQTAADALTKAANLAVFRKSLMNHTAPTFNAPSGTMGTTTDSFVGGTTSGAASGDPATLSPQQ